MTKRFSILIALFAMLAFSAAASFADPVLQFQSGLFITGGSMTLTNSNDLPQFQITNAPINGVLYTNTSAGYSITDGFLNLTCVGTSALCGTTNTFSITGTFHLDLNPLHDVTGTLVSGGLRAGADTSLNCFAGLTNVGSYTFDPSAPHDVLHLGDCSSATQVDAAGSGLDTKNTTMLAELGIPINEKWQFKGFSIGVDNSGGSPWTVTSTTFTDNGIGVPEPSSLLLLGSGLLGFVGLGLRKKTSKS